MTTRSAVSARSRAARSKQRYGSTEPRLFTPPLRGLTKETSLGFAAIKFAEDVCGITLYPWQSWLLEHALELAPGLTVETMNSRGPLDPLFRFRKVVVLVARQNGKSTLSQILSLFFLYVLQSDLVLGTAQDLDTAEEVWDGALDIIEETPRLARLADKPIRVNGKKTIRLLSGERYKVKAANRRAGRGLAGDLVLLDELREHQTWESWAAITKTTMARPAAMIWALSNAGDAASIVLRYLRKQAHAALGDPDGINADDDPSSLLPDDADVADMALGVGDLEPGDFDEDESTLGLFEWSATPTCAVTDVEGILQANPSTGYGISLRTLLGDANADPEWVFKTECMCIWSEGTLEGPFPPGAWDTCSDADSRRGGDAPVKLCVQVSWDRTRTHVALATRRADGVPHVELIASRAGTDWLVPWLTDPERSDEVREALVVVQKGSPAASLRDQLIEADVTVLDWAGADVPIGTAALYDAVRAAVETKPGLFHLGQPALNLAAAVALPKMTAGGSFMWDQSKSPADIAPLSAVTGAFWALAQPDTNRVSAYADHDLLVI